jgi:hypothetical protein
MSDANSGLLQHNRADKYTRQSDIDNALDTFVKRVNEGLDVHPALMKLVVRGVNEHLAGGKAWQVKQGKKPLSLSFLAAYKLAKEVHTNQEIADHLDVKLETAKGFNKKLGQSSVDDKIKFDFYVGIHGAMLKSGSEILYILLKDYGG